MISESEIEELDERTLDIVKLIEEEPRISRDELIKKLDLSEDEFDVKMEGLTEKDIVIRMTMTADSSMESRVPKKVFMLNPEKKSELQEFLK
ncbi:MAG: hypothetical protein KGY66_02445 [Candidatus Thermoplasmatota archaeon]|nr:hypothetical protein [Candidatus Thermoplasmatota archaeon]MBS3789753.1 hypothetical protein [Candidatus Thermoplasmatota archaeon]